MGLRGHWHPGLQLHLLFPIKGSSDFYSAAPCFACDLIIVRASLQIWLPAATLWIVCAMWKKVKVKPTFLSKLCGFCCWECCFRFVEIRLHTPFEIGVTEQLALHLYSRLHIPRLHHGLRKKQSWRRRFTINNRRAPWTKAEIRQGGHPSHSQRHFNNLISHRPLTLFLLWENQVDPSLTKSFDQVWAVVSFHCAEKEDGAAPHPQECSATSYLTVFSWSL